MFENHWCVMSMHNELGNQTGMDGLTPTQPSDLGKP